MTIETALEISSNPELIKRLAKYLAAMLPKHHARGFACRHHSGLADR